MTAIFSHASIEVVIAFIGLVVSSGAAYALHHHGPRLLRKSRARFVSPNGELRLVTAKINGIETALTARCECVVPREASTRIEAIENGHARWISVPHACCAHEIVLDTRNGGMLLITVHPDEVAA
jgi:hypothetical protein